MRRITMIAIALMLSFTLPAKEYHIAKTGHDQNPGTHKRPFLTIQAAADLAQPGDIITVHAGVYREWIRPPRGGVSDTERITYRAAEGEKVEINVRKSCFYPEKTNINYITIRGFHLSQAATQWAPPTAEQIGLIGTNWSKGWIIEHNAIRNSKCSGITLGKHGDQWDNTSENSAEGYVETIKRARARGWSRENIGAHIIRNNTISDCEQTGICGSMGGVFSVIEHNDIYNIWTKRQWTGAEMGGIKIHASIDMIIKNNRLANCGRGLWLDWMAQGTRVTGNLFYNNSTDDLFVEVNHWTFNKVNLSGIDTTHFNDHFNRQSVGDLPPGMERRRRQNEMDDHGGNRRDRIIGIPRWNWQFDMKPGSFLSLELAPEIFSCLKSKP